MRATIKSNGRFFSRKDLLYFYESSGVEFPLSEVPINRFASEKEAIGSSYDSVDSTSVSQTSKNSTSTQVGRLSFSKQRATIIPEDTQVGCAWKIAHDITSLEELKEKLEAFEGCHLKLTAKNTCFADGTPGSSLMLIGEAPGRKEDIQALPFVGRSGKLLNLILAAIGLRRDQVYIANTVPWRPPGNRTPTLMEVELCRPFVDRQIELAHPKILIALGGPASKSLTGSKESILRIRGQWHSYHTASGMKILVMPTLHPAYLLRRPAQKKLVWNDFLAVRQKLSQLY